MSDNIYDLYTELDSAGTFEPEDKEVFVGGKVNYSPLFLPSIQVYTLNNQSESADPIFSRNGDIRSSEVKLKYLHGYLDKGQIISAINCLSRSNGLSMAGRSYQVLAEHIILGRYFKDEDEFDGVEVGINLWPEFCLSDAHRSTSELKEYDTTEVNDELSIQPVETVWYTPVSDERLFNVIGSTLQREEEELVDAIQQTIADYKKANGKDTVFFDHKNDHSWRVKISKKTKAKDLNDLRVVVSDFCHLLFLFTGYPTTPISLRLFKTEQTSEGVEYPSYFNWLGSWVLDKKLRDRWKDQYRNFDAPISLDKVKPHWDQVLKTYYGKLDDIRPHLTTLISNVQDRSGSRQFKYTRTVDVLEHVARKANEKKHYQWAVETYAFAELQDKLLAIFNVTDTAKLGQAISATRAYVVHGDTAHEQIWETASQAPQLVECFELLVISYLQAEIGVPDDLRHNFQVQWLGKLEYLSWIRF